MLDDGPVRKPTDPVAAWLVANVDAVVGAHALARHRLTSPLSRRRCVDEPGASTQTMPHPPGNISIARMLLHHPDIALRATMRLRRINTHEYRQRPDGSPSPACGRGGWGAVGIQGPHSRVVRAWFGGWGFPVALLTPV